MSRIISVAVILIVAAFAIVAWMHLEKSTHPNAGLTAATPTASTAITPKVIAPARVIPADVNQNMQTALAARQQKLAQLAKGK